MTPLVLHTLGVGEAARIEVGLSDWVNPTVTLGLQELNMESHEVRGDVAVRINDNADVIVFSVRIQKPEVFTRRALVKLFK